jgi:hypothetical protein
MTISPSRTNDASPKAEKGHHRSLELATRQDPEARAVSQPGEFSTGTSGDYSAGTHSAANWAHGIAISDRSDPAQPLLSFGEAEADKDCGNTLRW